MKRLLSVTAVLLLVGVLFSATLLFPLKRAPEVTGYFGEYRGNSRNINYPEHFHMGMDYSTGSIVGLDLLSPDNSYVHQIYLNHPIYGIGIALMLPEVTNILTNEKGINVIFAHVNEIGDTSSLTGRKLNDLYHQLISEFGDQYIEVTFDPRELPFRKSDVVAKSGNSGNVPPHFHLEVRDSTMKTIINPGFYFDTGNPASAVEILDIRAGGKTYSFAQGKPTIEMTPSTPLDLHAKVQLRHPVSPKTIELYVENNLVYQIDFVSFDLDEAERVHEIYSSPSTESDYWFNLNSRISLSLLPINIWDDIDWTNPRDARVVVRDHWGNEASKDFRIVMRR